MGAFHAADSGDLCAMQPVSSHKAQRAGRLMLPDLARLQLERRLGCVRREIERACPPVSGSMSLASAPEWRSLPPHQGSSVLAQARTTPRPDRRTPALGGAADGGLQCDVSPAPRHGSRPAR